MAISKKGGFWTRAKIIWSIVIVLLLAGLGTVGYLYFTGSITFFAAALPQIDKDESSITLGYQAGAENVPADGKEAVSIIARLVPKRGSFTTEMQAKVDLVGCNNLEFIQRKVNLQQSQTDNAMLARWSVSSWEPCTVTKFHVTISKTVKEFLVSRIEKQEADIRAPKLTFIQPPPTNITFYPKFTEKGWGLVIAETKYNAREKRIDYITLKNTKIFVNLSQNLKLTTDSDGMVFPALDLNRPYGFKILSKE